MTEISTVDTSKPFSEKSNLASTPVDSQNISYFDRKLSNAAKFKKLFKNCYFYINDISLSYREYFEACQGRCCVSVVSFRNRLIDMILKRGGGIEVSLSPYVTHFIVERPGMSSTWWIFRRIKGSPKQYHFITAKYIVECHLKGKRMSEKHYYPRFLQTPKLFAPVSSSAETTPRRDSGESPGQNTRMESFRFTETWSQLLEAECLEDFQSMDCGIYMNGNILYIYLEDFLLETLMGGNLECPAAVCKYGQIVSVNSHSKKLGVRKGMDVQTALDLCSELRLAKYDYDKVTQKGLDILRLFKRYTPHILSPNYNEYHLQISYVSCQGFLENPSLSGTQNICTLAKQIYEEVPGECVIGIGKNMLISKLASKKCRNLKIDSQESDYDYELSPLLSITRIDTVWYFVTENICIVNDGFKFLNNIYLSEIPGVGSLWPVLKSKGLITCNDVRKIGSPLCLQSILGGRIGKLVYNFCFGYDYRCANLPKKQLDFFLNKAFSSSLTLDPQVYNYNETKSTDEVTQSTMPTSKDSIKHDILDKNHPHNDLEPVSRSKEFTQDNDGLDRETLVLRQLLSKTLKDLCSVYSLFDKCIINYSIKYKCTVVLQVYVDFTYSKAQTSIVDKQSLRHTVNSLFTMIKKELAIEFSDIKKINLEIKDITRVDENVKFIDRFLTEKVQDTQNTPNTFKELVNHLEFPFVTSKDSTDTPKEFMSTPTRRLNGWRLDALSSEPETPSNPRKGLNSRSGSKSPALKSDPTRSDSRGQSSHKSKLESSVESHIRTPSRTRKSLKPSKGQKYITEYLSPLNIESNQPHI